ncbi:uncharacterized protein LOC101207599 [Cucumis sativus]|uniref:Uncharacterized protein n=1 Tax=Cucumis sativus TaxID=3659 RepID=A0A0A0L3A4_CUCSA|nr:uncharacterized protein LOC101207599 [Cucumis sativus]KGN55067.1 hypothetical protein Csa_012426 [Cucumis sativus]
MATSPFPPPKTLNPSSPFLNSTSLTPFSNPLLQTLTLKPHHTHYYKPLSIISGISYPYQISLFSRPDIRTHAGRSKKKPGGPSPGRIEGNADFRRKLRDNARRKTQKLAESHFYRRKKSNRNYADNFSEDELQQIGLGYDRMVRFMEKDDPNLRHPYDWYKYGEFGPYSWRGVVVGEPIRGRFTDERVTIISEVKDHEEWEKIEQSEMAADFSTGLQRMDKSKGFRYFWVFVRHPRWRISELPWQQWTLIAEVVLESGKERLDKWSLMGRLGNKSRKNITQCAAWMRPDIIYVKKPVYQCRFEPQDEFFQAMMPFLDPKTEQDFLFELQDDEGNVEWVTYFGGLCKIVRINPKAFIDDVVNAYEKLSDEKKSKCLEFLLSNHPVPLLHPYTKEWKAKLEEEELGCDAPDEMENRRRDDNVITEWIETDNEEEYEEQPKEDIVMEDMDEDEDEDEEDDDEQEEGNQEEEEDEGYWDERFRKAISSPEELEKLFKRSGEMADELYEKENVGRRRATAMKDGDEVEMRGKKPKVKAEEWEYIGYGPWRKKIKKSQIPPELFLRSTVRPFTYRNLVKEIVLTRHAILDGEIGV